MSAYCTCWWDHQEHLRIGPDPDSPCPLHAEVLLCAGCGATSVDGGTWWSRGGCGGNHDAIRMVPKSSANTQAPTEQPPNPLVQDKDTTP